MATLKIRYGGEIISIDNSGLNFNPSTYGRARLNVKIGTKTEKYGLTTNTNATEYCKLRMKVGTNTAYLGRVSTVSYISGQTPTYNGSTSTLRNTNSGTRNSGSGSFTNPTNPGTPTVTNATGSTVTSNTSLYSTKNVYWKSQTGSATFDYNPINAHGGNATMSYSYTNTAVHTELKTRNAAANLGPGTSAADPGAATWTNATGSTVVTRRASADILTKQDTYNSFSQQVRYLSWTNQWLFDRQLPAVGANKTFTSRQTWTQWRSFNELTYNYYYTNNPTGAANARQQAANNAKTLETTTQAYVSFYKSTTRKHSNLNVTKNAGQAAVEGAWKTVQSPAATNIVKTNTVSYTVASSGNLSIKSTTSTKYITRETRTHREYQTKAPQALQVWYSNYYSKRWSYWYASSSKYTLSTYTGTYNQSFSSEASTWNASWSSCEKITLVTETAHNMNL